MPKGCSAEITLRFSEPEKLGCLRLKENIRMSQRIERFSVDIENNGKFKEIYSGTVVGYQRIVRLGGVTASALRIRITDARTEPTLARIALYGA